MSIKKSSFDLENWYPSLFSGVLVSAAVLLLSFSSLRTWRAVFMQGCSTLVPAALDISAIAIGFLATSLSLLLSLANTDIVKLMKRHGHHGRLVGFLREAISISFLWALMSALLTTFHLSKGGFWRYTAVYLWVYLCVCSVLCYYRASGILLEVLTLGDDTLSRKTAPEWNEPNDDSSILLDFTKE